MSELTAVNSETSSNLTEAAAVPALTSRRPGSHCHSVPYWQNRKLIYRLLWPNKTQTDDWFVMPHCGVWGAQELHAGGEVGTEELVDREGGEKGAGEGREVAPQCWVLMVETPLRLACAGHKRDWTEQVLWGEGLDSRGSRLRSVRFHTGCSLHWLFCIQVTERKIIRSTAMMMMTTTTDESNLPHHALKKTCLSSLVQQHNLYSSLLNKTCQWFHVKLTATEKLTLSTVISIH